MSETAKVLSMDIPLGQAKPYLIEWRKKPGEHHKEVQISVSRQDSVQWYCDKKFRVVKVDRHNDEKAPLPLFYRRFPEDNEEFASRSIRARRSRGGRITRTRRLSNLRITLRWTLISALRPEFSWTRGAIASWFGCHWTRASLARVRPRFLIS